MSGILTLRGVTLTSTHLSPASPATIHAILPRIAIGATFPTTTQATSSGLFSPPSATRSFTTSPAHQAKKKGKSGRTLTESEIKVRALKSNLFADPPPPLRMARNRHLRHWTIHRAWLLFQRRQREARDRELLRMSQGMSAACEELRLTTGPGTRTEGYLYRIAMEKKGVYGPNGIPIEYARIQTETPARVPWNHEWTKSKQA